MDKKEASVLANFYSLRTFLANYYELTDDRFQSERHPIFGLDKYLFTYVEKNTNALLMFQLAREKLFTSYHLVYFSCDSLEIQARKGTIKDDSDSNVIRGLATLLHERMPNIRNLEEMANLEL
jgi:hypothetical protein